MTIKASGRSALIIAAGIWACFPGPLQAEEGVGRATPTISKPAKATGAPIVLKKYTKSRHGKDAQRKFGKAAPKSDTGKRAAENDGAAKDGDRSTVIPPSVANANAQLPSAEAAADSATAMSAKANTMLQAAGDKPADAQPVAEAEVVAADQLNELDRELQESRSAAPTMALASAEAPPAPVMASGKEDSAWDQTSLIGKIFIGFGALLTMASAARMFMA